MTIEEELKRIEEHPLIDPKKAVDEMHLTWREGNFIELDKTVNKVENDWEFYYESLSDREKWLFEKGMLLGEAKAFRWLLWERARKLLAEANRKWRIFHWVRRLKELE